MSVLATIITWCTSAIRTISPPAPPLNHVPLDPVQSAPSVGLHPSRFPGAPDLGARSALSNLVTVVRTVIVVGELLSDEADSVYSSHWMEFASPTSCTVA